MAKETSEEVKARREQIAACVQAGKSPKEVAEDLGLAASLVRNDIAALRKSGELPPSDRRNGGQRESAAIASLRRAKASFQKALAKKHREIEAIERRMDADDAEIERLDKAIELLSAAPEQEPQATSDAPAGEDAEASAE
jgi:transposase